MPQRHLRLAYLRVAACMVLCAMLWSLSGCGGGGSGPVAAASSSTPTGTTSSGTATATQDCTTCGSAVVSLSDAPGDFLSYVVDVVSLKLTRSDGTIVETVPVTTQVDFAQLVELSEVLTAAQIPAGTYVSATLTVDYAGATIVVDNGTTGVTIAPGNVIDGTTSQPLVAPHPTRMTLTLSLGTGSEFVVTPGAVANLALDFNLPASNVVAPSTTNPTTVTVNPVLTATLAPDATKALRVRGALISADPTAGTYVIDVRPFSNTSNTAGQFTVGTTAQTTYAINGTSYTGDAGLTALAALPAGTITAADGTWDVAAHAYTATSVVAGTSVPGSVEGTVIARRGTTLTIANGCLLHAGLAGFGFAQEVSVTIGAATTVTEDGGTGSYTIADISVGQHVQFAGTLAMAATPGMPALDATAGSARLEPTPLVGVVLSQAGNALTVKLEAMDGVDASRLDFTGTGLTVAQDATAGAYTVAVPGTLAATTLPAGRPVRFLGFVAPFGSAPPDYNATSIATYAAQVALLQLRFASPGLATPFTTVAATGLALGQATLAASGAHSLVLAGQHLDPATLSGGLELVPDATAAQPAYAIAHQATQKLDTYPSYATFETALSSDLSGSDGMLELLAQGPYNAATDVLSMDQLIVVLAN